MKFSIDKSKIWFITLLFSLFMCDNVSVTFAMDLAGLAEEALGRAGVEAGDTFALAKDTIVEQFGKLSRADIEGLPEGVRSSLKEQIDAIAKEVKEYKGTLTKEDLTKSINGYYDVGGEEHIPGHKDIFYERIQLKYPSGVDMVTGGVLNKIGGIPLEYEAKLGKVTQGEIKAFDTGFTLDKEIPEPKIKTDAEIAHDDVIAQEKNLQDLYKSGASPDDIAAAKKALKGAKKDYATKSKAALEKTNSDLEKEQRAELQAQSNLKDAKNSGIDVDGAKNDVIKAKKAVKDAGIQSRNAIKDNAYQEMKQAKEARDTAQEAVNNAEKVYKDTSGGPEKVKEAKSALDDAQKAYEKARDGFNEKTGWLDKGWNRYAGEKIGTRFEAAREGAWEAIKASPGKIGEGVGKALKSRWAQAFAEGFIFSFPNMVLDSIETYLRNKAVLDTLGTVQSFGNILMKLPDSFINEEDPTNSLFIYVGVPNKDQDLTKEFLDTANYYASISEYGEVAQSPIAGSATPAYMMLHLNTGFKFVGDGVAYDEEQPTVPLLGNDKDALRSVLNELGGRAKKGPEGKTYQYYQIDRSTGYAGNAQIAALFDSPSESSDSYPPILQRTLNVLQNGTKFANMLVQGIKGLGGDDKNDKALWALITDGSTEVAPPNDQYVADGIYVYQTKDTPFIKNIKEAIAPEDINQEIAIQDLTDYVIMLDDAGQGLVPLQIPQPQIPSNFASYSLNLDAYYMMSLIDPSYARYSRNGDVVYAKSNPEDILNKFLQSVKDPNKVKEISRQIVAVQQFVALQAKNGPFSYGSAKMTITKDLLAKKIYIYNIPGYLGTGIDDYVIAIGLDENKKQVIVELPTSVNFFISLVTNKIYDGSFKPLKMSTKYFVVQQPGVTQMQVTTDPSKFPAGTKTICSGTAPLHTLFVAGPFNPNKCNGNDLPNENNWALAEYSFAQSQDKKQNIETYLEDFDKDLLDAINHSQSAWQKTVDAKNPDAVVRQMGPFNFTSDVLNIQITAVSEAAIINQNFVYVSDFYPDEYLVLATDAQGTDAGKAYNPGNPQKYAISLSNGYVYSAQAKDAQGAGQRVDQTPLDLQKILSEAQQNSNKYLDDLLVKIKRSEAVYNARIIRNLYGSDNNFAQFKFYLAQPDYFAGQYIYGDVTNLGVPLDAQGNEVAAVVNQIDNYFIAIERTSSSDACDGCPPVMQGKEQVKDDKGNLLYWHYSFGNKLSANTYAVASLISGATYDRENNYIGSYDQFVIKKSGISDILGFTTRMLADISQKSGGKAVRLEKSITQLTKSLLDRIKGEEKEIADAKNEQDRVYVPLSSSLKQQLDALTNDGSPVIPYLDNPNLLPRYVKYYNGKYYAVTPGYISSPMPVDANGKPLVSEYAAGPDRTYIDYNIDTIVGGAKDSYRGMVYDSDGNARLLLGPDKKWIQTSIFDPKLKKDIIEYKKTLVGPGWALVNARAYAGVDVADNGKQSRVIGIDAPIVPMGDASNSSKYLQATGFDTLRDSANGNTYDFYYHTQIDSYFVKVKTPKVEYYINLSSGYAYNNDGTPRWFEKPMYRDEAGNLLFIGTDQFDTLKIALYMVKDSSFAYYTMVGNFAAQITKDPYNARGIYCVMVNDNDPDQKIQLFQAQKDATSGALLTYYLIWDVSSDEQQTFLGKFIIRDAQYYSLLLYTQTRNKGEAIEQGKFIPEDNYVDATARVKKSKTIGIVYDNSRKLMYVIYQDQLCAVQGNTIVVKNSDGSTRTVTITQNKKSLQPAHATAVPGLTAEWISFEDGNKIYDFVYDMFILNPQPEVTTSDQPAHLSLYSLKHGNPNLIGKAGGGFGLNVSGFVKPTQLKQAQEKGAKGPISGAALVSLLQANQNVDQSQIVFPPSVKSDEKNQLLDNLQYIMLDDSGALFINNLVSGPTKRYVYTLGQNQDVNQVYYAPGLKGWFVDLANGILYEPADSNGLSYPSGLSLMPMQLYALLDMLQLSVVYDSKGQPQLVYRTMSKGSSLQNLTQAYPSVYSPKTKASFVR